MLGVQRASLYSYASRGLLKAQRLVGRRGTVYLLSDVQRLVRQRQAVRNPAQLAQSTLDWGQAVLDSHHPGARRTAFATAATAPYNWHRAPLEETAMLLWQQSSTGPAGVDEAPARQGARHMPQRGTGAGHWFGMAAVPRIIWHCCTAWEMYCWVCRHQPAHPAQSHLRNL
jgi:citrate synthase